MSLLDFIRYEMDLPGTKVGCREGDCGACTVMLGSLVDLKMIYRSVVSCLTPLGNVQGKHVVTIEGLSMEVMGPVQQSIVDHSGTQCGFCTPGFVMSLTAHGFSEEAADPSHIRQSIAGNLCRCTGYKSIEAAARDVASLFQSIKKEDPLKWMVAHRFLPAYFQTIPQQIADIRTRIHDVRKHDVIVGGGTDLYVQHADELLHADLGLFAGLEEFKGIDIGDRYCSFGASVTADEIMTSEALLPFFPLIKKHFKLISSTQIRNTATLAGNIINASPIGDLTIFFLALDATIIINHKIGSARELPLKDFFQGYKKTAMQAGEYVASIKIPLPDQPSLFNFEKISKRQHLDIASVNTALCIRTHDDFVEQVFVSAGGVAPVPLFLKNTAAFLAGKKLTAENLTTASNIMQQEIHPISDIRGSETYKRLLLRQLFFAHFIELFPAQFSLSDLVPNLCKS